MPLGVVFALFTRFCLLPDLGVILLLKERPSSSCCVVDRVKPPTAEPPIAERGVARESGERALTGTVAVVGVALEAILGVNGTLPVAPRADVALRVDMRGVPLLFVPDVRSRGILPGFDMEEC